MKRIVFIGTIGCGKTTLGQAIHGDELRYRKHRRWRSSDGISSTHRVNSWNVPTDAAL